MAEATNPYRVLGLNVGATPREIARAYRSEVRRYHPDTMSAAASSSGFRMTAEKSLAQVMEAYETLSRPSAGTKSERAGDTPPPHQAPSVQTPFDRSQSHHVTVRRHEPRLFDQDTPPIQISPLRWEPFS